MTHLQNLLFYIPDLPTKRILDVGVGKGKFITDCSLAGFKVSGIEYNKDNVAIAKSYANKLGVSIDVKEGRAESLAFLDESFDFVNLSEVIEHVDDPVASLREVFRVLTKGGQVYISVPSRYGWYDPHFHLAFVNWLPRAWSNTYIKIFGKSKHFDGHSGHQSLSEMHYYTFLEFNKLAKSTGFLIDDMRLLKIQKRFNNFLLQKIFTCVYLLVRPWYFRTFHFKLTKPY